MEYRFLVNSDPLLLLNLELADPERAKAWGIDTINGLEKIKERLQLLSQIYPDYLQEIKRLDLTDTPSHVSTLWNLWLPLSLHLAQTRQQLNRPLIQGILGGQGTGKTTLCSMVSLILSHLNYQALSLSLDDLYKTYQERQNLLKTSPLLIWRGPPGTHDVELGIELIEQVKQAKSPILVPQFDKSQHNGEGDRIEPKLVERVDILLFEGWFVGVQPIQIELEDPLTKESNQRLYEYLPLWEKLDQLMVLLPQDYTLSKQWRNQAEQKMKRTGKAGMSEEQINKFVEYFWRSLPPELFITLLTENTDLVNLIIEINSNHGINQVRRVVPGNQL